MSAAAQTNSATPVSEATVDAVCDCVSAAVAMGLSIDHLPADRVARRQRIDRWRAWVIDAAPPPPGGDDFAAACEIYQRTADGEAVLRRLTDGPGQRRAWRRRLRPVGGYLIILWILGLAVWAFTGSVIGQVLGEANAELVPLTSLGGQGGGDAVPPLWSVSPTMTLVMIGIAAVWLIIGVGAWWPLLSRLIARPAGLTDWQSRDRGRWLDATLPLGLVLTLGAPLVVGVLLSLFVPLIQFYHHLSLALAS